MSNEVQIEKTISEQIFDRMIEILRDSENFTDSLLDELENINLSSKKDVKEIISKEEINENS
mgnify:CR=1 FL=1